MIRFETKSGGLMVVQELISPSVYLDHWAFREIADSKTLTKRFSEALFFRGGTLVLSWLNIVEFCKVTIENQRHNASSFLDKIGPNVFWINPDFLTVAKYKSGRSGNCNCPLPDMENATIHLKALQSKSQNQSTASLGGGFDVVFNSKNIKQQFDELGSLISSQFDWMRGDPKINKSLRKPLQPLKLEQPNLHATGLIARELIGPLVNQRDLKISHNDAIDLTHTAVPVSYCDYVLLDNGWTTRVNQMRKRFTTAGVCIPMAKVFSKKNDGLESFFKELDSFVAG
jgi:hypothetical protein